VKSINGVEKNLRRLKSDSATIKKNARIFEG